MYYINISRDLTRWTLIIYTCHTTLLTNQLTEDNYPFRAGSIAGDISIHGRNMNMKYQNHIASVQITFSKTETII